MFNDDSMLLKHPTHDYNPLATNITYSDTSGISNSYSLTAANNLNQ